MAGRSKGQAASDDSKRLGALLKKLRKAKGWSINRLGQLSGISAAYIFRLEAGDRKPSRALLESLAQVLIPRENQAERDELILIAGYLPEQFKNLMGGDDAKLAYQRAIGADPQNFQAFFRLVMHLVCNGESMQARELIQEGLQTFYDMVQLQALLSALELSKGYFSQAIRFQQEAIRYYHQAPDSQRLVELQDLLWGLGRIYLQEGYRQLGNRVQTRCHALSPNAQVEPLPSAFAEAIRNFRRALALVPQDIRLLDELARIHCTLGDYSLPEQAQRHWRTAITAWEAVVHAQDKLELGYHKLLESMALLALLYSRTGQFQQAWFTLSLGEVCLPNFWLVHYVKACHFGLRILAEHQGTLRAESQTLFAEALKSLAAAVEIEEPDNRAREQAETEPALAPLQVHCPKEFARLLKVRSRAKDLP